MQQIENTQECFEPGKCILLIFICKSMEYIFLIKKIPNTVFKFRLHLLNMNICCNHNAILVLLHPKLSTFTQ